MKKLATRKWCRIGNNLNRFILLFFCKCIFLQISRAQVLFRILFWLDINYGYRLHIVNLLFLSQLLYVNMMWRLSSCSAHYNLFFSSGCRDGWKGYDGCCYYVGRDAMTQPNAQNVCERKGAELASILNEKERDFVDTLT